LALEGGTGTKVARASHVREPLPGASPLTVDRPRLPFPLQRSSPIHRLFEILNQIVRDAEREAAARGVFTEVVAVIVGFQKGVVRTGELINL
jgi:hypothetical protein